jgi:hypothetical protein
MLLAEFLARVESDDFQRKNPNVRCNALYKNTRNLNCYLTASEAVQAARCLLEKAQLIFDNGIEDAAVQVWNKGEGNERLYFGLTQARKGGRRRKSHSVES